MKRKKNKVCPKRQVWAICPVTKIIKSKKKYSRKSKYKLEN